MINRISDYLQVPKAIIKFGLLSIVIAMSFSLFSLSEKIGECIGKLLFIVTH
ncbi:MULTISPECIES: hypothetical protein [Bacillaceae]|uniref:hypothetical protein n=1 Tax=Bacillaceae TaxID=186817 RepID=UPI001E5F8A32|nr:MULTISPECIES: hypothetical protein [Bacillaceae]MCE4048815.1 hypothetical protein [Bacillus sp. Au-Bac7]UPO90675.1 hypothetical protein L8T27_021765 [Niallia sp. Man26]